MKLNTRVAIGVVALCAGASFANADVVYVNSTKAPVQSILAVGPEGTYHISDKGDDMFLKSAPGVNASVQSFGLGNNYWLDTRAYDIYLSHKKGQGLTYKLISQGITRTLTLALPYGKSNASGGGDGGGDGSGGGGGGGDGSGGGNGSVPPNWYNAIRWDMFATRTNSKTLFAWFTFSSPDLAIADGAFYNGQANPNLGRPHAEQWIVSNGNLLDHDWTAFGRVQCFMDSQLNQDDNAIGANVTLLAVQSPVVPAPGAAVMAGVACLTGLRRRR